MRLRTAVIGTIGLVVVAGCSAYAASSPYGVQPGAGGGGGPAGSVTVGNGGQIAFMSSHNGTVNPAVDTVAVGSTVTWTWTNNQGISHSVQSQGAGVTTFASSPIMSGNGQTYAVTFAAPGTYQYDCAVHGAAMSGRIVVR